MDARPASYCRFTISAMTLALPQLRPGLLRKEASRTRHKISVSCTWPETVHSLRRRTAFRTSAQSPDDTGSSQGSRARPSQTDCKGQSWLDFSKGIPDLLSADEETETAREKFWGKLAVLILGVSAWEPQARCRHCLFTTLMVNAAAPSPWDRAGQCSKHPVLRMSAVTTQPHACRLCLRASASQERGSWGRWTTTLAYLSGRPSPS